MQHRRSDCGIAGDKFQGRVSGDVGDLQRVGNLQTKGLQTSDGDYELGIPIKHSKKEGDWFVDRILQAEFGMPKNHGERTGDIRHEVSIAENRNLTPAANPSCCSHTSTKPIAAGMQIPWCLRLPPRTIEMLKSAMRNPPVTVSTLGELNLTWMMHYINLRCDINFDHDLHFTPIKGPRGEEKRSQAMDYWLALEAEFKIYQHHSRVCLSCEKAGPASSEIFKPRLSTMFQDLKNLLETLVPDKDHDQVATNLDIDLITQQVANGVLDVGRLSRWLAKLLKSHCAPMRDESAEMMAEKLEFGAKTGDLSILINGLESLFGFLEAMKLDVANHQIRTFRYILIKDTTTFQQSHFQKRINDGRLNLATAKAWYQDAYERFILRGDIRAKNNDLLYFEAFTHGLVDLCSSSPEVRPVPITLHYDQGRIHQLRADVQDLVILQLCTEVFNELLTRLGCRNYIPPLAYATLQGRLLTIADDEMAQPGFILWSEKVEDIAIEITRAAFVVSSLPQLPNIPPEAFDDTRCRLQEVFEEYYRPAEEKLLSQVAEQTLRHAADFQKMSTLDISEAQKQYQQNRQQRGDLALPNLENTARMLAHMGVIHWQVWRDLAYMPDMERSELAPDEIPPEQVSVKPFSQGKRSSSESIKNDGCSKAVIENQTGHACDNT